MIVTMVPAPFGFFEVEEKVVGAEAAQFSAPLNEAPEALSRGQYRAIASKKAHRCGVDNGVRLFEGVRRAGHGGRFCLDKL